MTNFKAVANRYDGPALEKDVLQFWNEHDIFNKTLAMREGGPRFSFNEGPPTANGKPGIHHVLARSFKDIYPRYKTMRHYYAPRKAGWDTHGLPVEHQIEKELQIFDKTRIEQEVGIEEFTRRCRDSVLRYIRDWEDMTQRMGFWVDLGDAYYTLDNDYIESVWSLLKQIWDKDLIYQGYKVVPYDPRIGATLSSHEVAQGYKNVSDPSVYLRFRLSGSADTSFLVWTTTPWTLPANLFLAVGEEIDYSYLACDDEVLIIATELIETVMVDACYEVIKTVKGKELVGLSYQRVFDYLSVEGDCFRVHAGDFVSTEDGTGIVHCAPAYGADDLALGQAASLPILHAINLDGNFKDEIAPVAGMFFKDGDPILIQLLRERGLLFRESTIKHNYPFGWRTGDPLLYYAKNAWYIRTSSLRMRMVELNQTINWVPENIRSGRFGKWLENNIDWALSRERFWGTPLPIWTDGAGTYHCIGSLAELESLCGRKLTEIDLHRPAIDEITYRCNETGKLFTRVPEVIDCWFDSGAMSYAQWHYPFENHQVFADHFPADYICEAIDQTRGWFYTLHAIGCLVSDQIAYKNCICLGHIVDEKGQKMSKSKGNIIDPYEVFDHIGADPLRWYLLARVSPEGQKRISEGIIADVAKSFLNTLWNTYTFFILYARLDRVDVSKFVPLQQRPEIDRWILAHLQKTIQVCTESLDAYDARRAGGAIETFVDQLSNWYVRRNRRRFWKASESLDKQSAYLTLYQCLTVVTRLIAPFMPFVSEHIYANLSRGEVSNRLSSVHMCDWPECRSELEDTQLLEEFQVVQRLVSLGRMAREQSKVRVRQPLPRIKVCLPDAAAIDACQKHREQLLDELNVKRLEFITNEDNLVEYRIKPNLPRLGKRCGKLLPQIRQALARMDGNDIVKRLADEGSISLHLEASELRIAKDDLLIETESAKGFSCAREGEYLLALDVSLDQELLREGLAREVIRSVQDARKQADLYVADRINLMISGDAELESVLHQYRDLIMAETLATTWSLPENGKSFAGGYDDRQWQIILEKSDCGDGI